MPICITCTYPVPSLYTTYSKADDRTLGKGVRLTQCPNCKHFADKYVEHDYVVLFIDLVLIKPQVYRHLLFNRLGASPINGSDTTRRNDKLDPSILRLGTLLVLFDVYITWARIERASSLSGSDEQSRKGTISQAPIITQYLFFLTLNVASTLAQHFTIRMLAHILLSEEWSGWRGVVGNYMPDFMRRGRTYQRSFAPPSTPYETVRSPITPHLTSPTDDAHSSTPRSSPSAALPSPPHTSRSPPSGASISTALLVSSCTKLFPILLVIWPTTNTTTSSSPDATPSPLAAFTARATSYITYIVLFNNIEALLILLDTGYVLTTALAVAGVGVRWGVEGWLLGLGGVAR